METMLWIALVSCFLPLIGSYDGGEITLVTVDNMCNFCDCGEKVVTCSRKAPYRLDPSIGRNGYRQFVLSDSGLVKLDCESFPLGTERVAAMGLKQYRGREELCDYHCNRVSHLNIDQSECPLVSMESPSYRLWNYHDVRELCGYECRRVDDLKLDQFGCSVKDGYPQRTPSPAAQPPPSIKDCENVKGLMRAEDCKMCDGLIREEECTCPPSTCLRRNNATLFKIESCSPSYCLTQHSDRLSDKNERTDINICLSDHAGQIVRWSAETMMLKEECSPSFCVATHPSQVELKSSPSVDDCLDAHPTKLFSSCTQSVCLRENSVTLMQREDCKEWTEENCTDHHPSLIRAPAPSAPRDQQTACTIESCTVSHPSLRSWSEKNCTDRHKNLIKIEEVEPWTEQNCTDRFTRLKTMWSIEECIKRHTVLVQSDKIPPWSEQNCTDYHATLKRNWSEDDCLQRHASLIKSQSWTEKNCTDRFEHLIDRVGTRVTDRLAAAAAEHKFRQLQRRYKCSASECMDHHKHLWEWKRNGTDLPRIASPSANELINQLREMVRQHPELIQTLVNGTVDWISVQKMDLLKRWWRWFLDHLEWFMGALWLLWNLPIGCYNIIKCQKIWLHMYRFFWICSLLARLMDECCCRRRRRRVETPRRVSAEVALPLPPVPPTWEQVCDRKALYCLRQWYKARLDRASLALNETNRQLELEPEPPIVSIPMTPIHPSPPGPSPSLHYSFTGGSSNWSSEHYASPDSGERDPIAEQWSAVVAGWEDSPFIQSLMNKYFCDCRFAKELWHKLTAIERKTLIHRLLVITYEAAPFVTMNGKVIDPTKMSPQEHLMITYQEQRKKEAFDAFIRQKFAH